ncbi:MAG: bacterial Ig-like domain-containing protein [Lachnospiraceae bacterium]|nr:bacterial Ig-like domain-containing protein [Lachnospiraceae bacterium]
MITVFYGNLTDSLTIVFVKKEEPKKEDPKKDEPEEPKKDEPKKNQVVIKVGDNAKTTYDVNEKFDATGLTIETVDESGKTITIPVTEQMVSGFDSSKPADIVITISYKGVTETLKIEVVQYNTDTTFKENGDFYSVTHRTKNDQITFSLHTGVRVDGNSVPDKYISKKSGSLHLLISAEYMKTLPAGEHELEILFKDGKSTVKFTVAATPASDATPVTGDTSSLTMWMILLAAAAAVMVMLRVYAAKRSDAE